MHTIAENIIHYRKPAHVQLAEKERTLNAIRFRMALSVLSQLLERGEITASEFDQGRTMLARRFNQDA